MYSMIGNLIAAWGIIVVSLFAMVGIFHTANKLSTLLNKQRIWSYAIVAISLLLCSSGIAAFITLLTVIINDF